MTRGLKIAAWAVGIPLALLVVLGVVLSFFARADADGLDWSQFVPDVLSGLFTGAVVAVVVGIVLSRWESQQTLNRGARKAILEWEGMRNQVAAAMPNSFSKRHSDAQTFVSQIAPLLKLVETKRASELAELAPTSYEAPGLLLTVVSNGHSLLTRAREVEVTLGQAVLKAGVQQGYEAHFIATGFAIALGNDEATVAQVVGLSQPQQYVQIATQAIQSIPEELEVFLDFVNHYSELWDALRVVARGSRVDSSTWNEAVERAIGE